MNSKKCYVILTHPRFIPVYTGNTNFTYPYYARFSVYPCVYREHGGGTISFDGFDGLSLCVQGTFPPMSKADCIARFIPVCTRNTFLLIVKTLSRSVYPCVYREHALARHKWRHNGGLSLCVQGTHFLFISFIRIFRFIPVCTGNTHESNIKSICNTVYPCVYMEHTNYNILFYN